MNKKKCIFVIAIMTLAFLCCIINKCNAEEITPTNDENDIKKYKGVYTIFNQKEFNNKSRKITEEEYNNLSEEEKNNVDKGLCLLGTEATDVEVRGEQNGILENGEHIDSTACFQGIYQEELKDNKPVYSNNYINSISLFPETCESKEEYEYVDKNYEMKFEKQLDGFYQFDSSINEYFNAHPYFSISTEIPFIVTDKGNISSIDGTKFPSCVQVTTDGEIWIFIDNKLIVDLGGIHGGVYSKILFSDNQVFYQDVYSNGEILSSVLKEFPELDKSKEHILKIFYASRKGKGTNICLRYNFCQSGICENFYDKNNNQILKSNIVPLPIGDTYISNAVDISGYKFNSKDFDQIVVENGIKNINYYYEKIRRKKHRIDTNEKEEQPTTTEENVSKDKEIEENIEDQENSKEKEKDDEDKNVSKKDVNENVENKKDIQESEENINTILEKPTEDITKIAYTNIKDTTEKNNSKSNEKNINSKKYDVNENDNNAIVTYTQNTIKSIEKNSPKNNMVSNKQDYQKQNYLENKIENLNRKISFLFIVLIIIITILVLLILKYYKIYSKINNKDERKN